ncbi:hypothetical protein [Methanorbis furvi]
MASIFHHKIIMRKHIYLILTKEENDLLDEIIHSAGFTTRSGYIAAVAKTTLYGLNTGEWIEKIRKLATDKNRTEAVFFALLSELAFPAIAMKGSKIALEALIEELKSEMYNRTGIVPETSDLERLAGEYETLYRPELLAYRTETRTRTYLEENP